MRGGLTSRFFKVDFTLDELLLFPLVDAPLKIPYSDCRGRTETLNVYSPEEILVEKLCALLDRTEPRDLFDIHYMLIHRLADAEAVSFHLTKKMANKGLKSVSLGDVLERKRNTFNRLWELRLGGQMAELPHLDAVIRETNRWFRQSGLVSHG